MLALLLAATAALSAEPPDPAGALVDRLAEDVDAAWAILSDQDETPHYLAVTVTDVDGRRLVAREGTVASERIAPRRTLDVDLRVGTPELDSTHALRGMSAWADDSRREVVVAHEGPGVLDDLSVSLWRELDRAYAEAAEHIVLLRSDRSVLVEEEHPAPDFEPREGVADTMDVPPLDLDLDAWRPVMVAVSAALDADPAVEESQARLGASRRVSTMVDSAGTRLVHGRTHVRVSMQVQGVADDGDEVSLFHAVDVHDPDGLPDAEALLSEARRLSAQLAAMKAAPRVGPYTGPVLLSGRAAGVFFHEVMGHRVEGHRQKSETEGKTFLEYVGRPVLPAWIDVYDDPTLHHLHGHDLNGHYAYDDEGVAAQRAELVDDGIFQGFLMSRSPLDGFPHSNGHGRRSTGHLPTARMGNTVVEAARTMSAEALRERLIEEVRRQGLEYGYVVEAIDGGFTLTGRVMPNAFNVRASVTRRVYADGRPDELVRGIDLVGTPLVVFGSILAAGDTPEVFNGTCGAESGWVPVSAVAPPLLFQQLEFQLKEKGQDRPPLLDKPRPRDGTAALPPAGRTGGAR